jgi:hypothetical protein
MRATGRVILLCMMLLTVAAADAGPTPLSVLLDRAARLEPGRQAELTKSAVTVAREMSPGDVVDALLAADERAFPVAVAVAGDLLARGVGTKLAAPLGKHAARLGPMLAATARPEAVDLLLPLLDSDDAASRLAGIRSVGGRKVRIHTIGNQASAAFMKRVAELTGGHHGVL